MTTVFVSQDDTFLREIKITYKRYNETLFLFFPQISFNLKKSHEIYIYI